MLKINLVRKSNLSLIKAKLFSLKNRLLKIVYSQQKKYQQIEEILKLLNSPNLQNEDPNKINEILESPLLASEEEIEKYLSKTNYTHICLKDIKEKEKQILDKFGINLEYLKMNTKIITQTGVLSEVEPLETEKIAYENTLRAKNCQLKPESSYSITFGEDNQSITRKRIQIENEYIYAICPISGKIIASNCSLLVTNIHDICFYRFVGEKVFYLIALSWNNLQKFIYFPDEELIIGMFSLPTNPRNIKNCYYLQVIINQHKLNNIKLRKEVFKYIITGNKQKVLFLGSTDNGPAIYIANYISALDTFKKSIVESNAKILVYKPMYFGKIEELFPEIDAEHIELINCPQDEEQKFETILKNNYYVIIIAQLEFLTENLAIRVQNHSRKQCSEEFLNNLQEIRNKHFPLMMVQLRSNRRKWLSQIEGITNIINTLGKEYPSLGVVFDGYSRVSFEEDDEKLIKAINEEKEIVQGIRKSLTVNVPIYDTCGSLMYESIMWASVIDFYFGNGASSGTVKPSWIANKPGVTHEPAELHLPKEERSYWGEWTPALWRENGKMPLCIPKEFITDYPMDEVKNWMYTDYDFDWRIAYKEIIRLISLLPKNG